MERGHEAETQESSRRSAWQARWAGAQRGQTPRQPRKRPQGRPGQKPQEENCRPPQRAVSAPGSPQETIELMIASIRVQFGPRAIGLGEQGIRSAGNNERGARHAYTANFVWRSALTAPPRRQDSGTVRRRSARPLWLRWMRSCAANISLSGSPIKFSDFKPKITGAPLLGEHTDEVLTKLGYSAEQITKMRKDKIV
jgi:hypothetical protein